MSSYRQALKAARSEHIRKLIDNNQNNPRFLFSTVARLTNKQMSPYINIPSQFNSNDFINVFPNKIDNIRNTITLNTLLDLYFTFLFFFLLDLRSTL